MVAPKVNQQTVERQLLQEYIIGTSDKAGLISTSQEIDRIV